MVGAAAARCPDHLQSFTDAQSCMDRLQTWCSDWLFRQGAKKWSLGWRGMRRPTSADRRDGKSLHSTSGRSRSQEPVGCGQSRRDTGAWPPPLVAKVGGRDDGSLRSGVGSHLECLVAQRMPPPSLVCSPCAASLCLSASCMSSLATHAPCVLCPSSGPRHGAWPHRAHLLGARRPTCALPTRAALSMAP